MKRLWLIALAIAALALAACGSSSSSSNSAPSSGGAASGGKSGGGLHVSMKSLAFSPATVHAKVGETVTWSNDDSPPHNVTYVSGPKFTSSSTLNPGSTFQLKLSQAGTIQYYCTIHPFMKGTIVVSP